MATEIPTAITMPDRVETRLGTLRFTDGFPDAATVEKVYDNLDFQRGVQAFLTAMPAASLSAMREGLKGVGVNNGAVVLFESLMDSKTLFLTPNTESIYFAGWLDLKDGPLVVETPPNILGFVNDFWFKLRDRHGKCRAGQGSGRQVPPAATWLPGRRAHRLLRVAPEHVRQLAGRTRVHGERQPHAGRREHQEASPYLSAVAGSGTTGNDVHQRQRQGVQHDPRDGLLVLRRGRQGCSGGAGIGDGSGNAGSARLDRHRERQALQPRRTDAEDPRRSSGGRRRDRADHHLQVAHQGIADLPERILGHGVRRRQLRIPPRRRAAARSVRVVLLRGDRNHAGDVDGEGRRRVAVRRRATSTPRADRSTAAAPIS